MSGCFIEMFNEHGGKSTYTCKCMDCKHFTIMDDRLYDENKDDIGFGWCMKKDRKTCSYCWSSVCEEFDMINELYCAICEKMLENVKV